MTPQQYLSTAVAPALALLPPECDTPGARVQLLATAMQESGLTVRIQVPSGAARSFCQMEKNGAVLNVFTNDRSRPVLQAVCKQLDIPCNLDALFEAIAWHDVLAVVVARLQYWLSPLDMPAVGDPAAALATYAATWRPAWHLVGQPEPGRWDAAYAAAISAVAPTA
jgi:hypothetical protein